MKVLAAFVSFEVKQEAEEVTTFASATRRFAYRPVCSAEAALVLDAGEATMPVSLTNEERQEIMALAVKISDRIMSEKGAR